MLCDLAVLQGNNGVSGKSILTKGFRGHRKGVEGCGRSSGGDRGEGKGGKEVVRERRSPLRERKERGVGNVVEGYCLLDNGQILFAPVRGWGKRVRGVREVRCAQMNDT